MVFDLSNGKTLEISELNGDVNFKLYDGNNELENEICLDVDSVSDFAFYG